MPHSADESTTDGDGRYELLQLREGDYYLGINLDRNPSKENPYPRWFYGGTDDPRAATVVHVVDRPGTTKYDFVLPAKPTERVIEGLVI